jgi:hypothetical protein
VAVEVITHVIDVNLEGVYRRRFGNVA